MRYLLAVLVLVAVIAGVSTRAPREIHRPPPRGGYPPPPTALEESGLPDPESVPASPAAPRVHRPAHTARPAPAPAAHAQTRPVVSPPTQVPDAGMRPVARPDRIRERDAALEAASPVESQPGREQMVAPALPRDVAAGAPVVTPPILHTPAAGYPEDGYRVQVDRAVLTPRLRIEAAQGRVVLRILVRPDGSVAQVDVAASSGVPALDRAATQAAAGWTFTPATRDGQSIEAWVVITVRFVVP